MLKTFDALPAGFLDAPAPHLHRILDGPTLIHLPGRRPEPLFVSCLLHGNEDTGLAAVQGVLRGYTGQGLPRALSILVGNVAAARAGVRRLDDQPDYNRIWPGADEDGRPEHAMAREVFDAMRRRGVFATIDIHNNTGFNPLYACVNRLDAASLHLATFFSRTVVHFTRPRGVLTTAFATLCPSVALECGRPGSPAHEARAAEFVEACLHLSAFPAHPVAPQDIDLYHTVGIVKVRETASFGFAPNGADILFEPDLDHLNFRELPAGTRLARVRGGGPLPVDVWDEGGANVAERFLEVRDGELRTRRPVMPAMLTLEERAIRLDCLCYFMERIGTPLADATGPAQNHCDAGGASAR
jgi:hypothetical protein